MHISRSFPDRRSKQRPKRPSKCRIADSYSTTGEDYRMRVLHAAAVLALAASVICPTAGWAQGDAAHGESVFARFCAGCHGPDGRGGAHTFMPHVDTLTKKGYIDQVARRISCLRDWRRRRGRRQERIHAGVEIKAERAGYPGPYRSHPFTAKLLEEGPDRTD